MTTKTKPAANKAEAAKPAAETPMPAAEDAVTPTPTERVGPTKVVWKDDHMTSSFANVVNVFSTREEVTLLFGQNQTWNALDSDALTVELSNRITMTPYAAKRMSILLARRVKEYEDRFGKLDF